MKKHWVTLLSAVVAVALVASTALAAQGENKGQANKPAHMVDKKDENQSETEEQEADTEASVQTGETVTFSVYGKAGKKGYIGLQKAFENVKGTSAEARIAQILETKYGVEVEASAELANLADELESEGDLESATLVQEEAVKADIKNIGLYKKLGKLYDKMGNNGVRAYVNGVHPKFDVPPVIKEGRVLIPFRAISEALKAEVLWNQEERSVTVTRGDTVVILIIDSHIALVNGVEVSLDVPGQLENGRTLVPIRFLSEAFKAEAIWEQETKSVIIIEEDNADEADDEEAAE